jgi:pilus assembly protein CpaB
MDRRRLLLILAVFVALIGTALVFLYVKGANDRAQKGVASVDVLVATQNIAASESYDTALSSGKIQMKPVAQSYVDANPGAVTSTETLKGKLAVSPVLTGQVIVEGQWGATVSTATSSPLPIPPGMVAISVNLTDPDRVAGNILNGSEVAIFVTGTLSPNSKSSTSAAEISTRLLLPKVAVLNVGSPVPVTSTTTDTTGNQTTETLPRTLLTLAVTQKEAQKVIYSSKNLDLTFALLTTKSKVHPGPGTSNAALFR